MALNILVWLGMLDRMIFREKPAVINFSLKFREFQVAHHPDNSEVRYTICLDGLADSMKKEKEKGCLWIPGNRRRRRLRKPTWNELIIPIAAHEVRHRVQTDRSVKQFSSESSEMIEDDLLRSIVEYNGLVFQEEYAIYFRENRSEDFIGKRLSLKEFDAKVAEQLVANMIHRKDAYSFKEIASAIQLQAP